MSGACDTNSLCLIYTGDMDDVCPISFVPLDSISRPVGFDTAHAFECEYIVEWLTKHRCINPVTGEKLGPVLIKTILHPLIVGECLDLSYLAQTVSILSNAGTAVDSESQVLIQKNELVKCSFFALIHVMSRQPHGPLGFQAPPTTWQEKVRTDLALTVTCVIFELICHISWTMLTGADNLILADFPFMVMAINVIISGVVCRAFCTDYPINGHMVLIMIIINYVVTHIAERCTKNLHWASGDDTLSHHFHVLNIDIVAIKFILDFATVVLRYDVR